MDRAALVKHFITLGQVRDKKSEKQEFSKRKREQKSDSSPLR